MSIRDAEQNMSNDMQQVRAARGRQISIFVDDRPGTLARLTLRLGEAGINIHALSLAEGLDHGYVRMVVDRPDEAIRQLESDGHLFFEREVILLEIPNAPSALGRVAERWGLQGINIEYVYCAGGPGVDHGLVVVRVDRIDDALASLET